VKKMGRGLRRGAGRPPGNDDKLPCHVALPGAAAGYNPER